MSGHVKAGLQMPPPRHLAPPPAERLMQAQCAQVLLAHTSLCKLI